MELRILRKSVKRFDQVNDAEVFQHHDKLQYRIRMFDVVSGTESFEWQDVPVINE